MGHMKELLNGKRKGGNKANVARSLDGLGAGTGKANVADYGDIDPDGIVKIVLEITRRGGAVSFGMSRDRGAFNVTLMLDDQRKTVWIGVTEDAEAKIEEIVTYLSALPD